jgi:hypothetical protein
MDASVACVRLLRRVFASKVEVGAAGVISSFFCFFCYFFGCDFSMFGRTSYFMLRISYSLVSCYEMLGRFAVFRLWDYMVEWSF